MRRDDIRGRKAPGHLQRVLAAFGRNLYGEPLYRLVWAPSRVERIGGIWTDWDPTVSQKERQAGAASPLRRVAEMRVVQKYPNEECWLIERWIPARSYGEPEQWYSPAADGGTMIQTPDGPMCACGEYPQYGDFEDIGVRMNWYPAEDQIRKAVAFHAAQLEKAPPEPWKRALLRTMAAEKEQEQRDAEYERFSADVLSDSDQAFHGAQMVGYGGTRRHSSVEMCERIGIRNHPF